MKIISGIVSSKKMLNTAVVRVVQNIAHPTYKKRIKSTKKYHVQDDLGALVNETVKFVECMPVSKTKRWKIIEIVGRKSEKKANPAKKGGEK